MSNALSRIRTGVVAATKRSTNHYTNSALVSTRGDDRLEQKGSENRADDKKFFKTVRTTAFVLTRVLRQSSPSTVNLKLKVRSDLNRSDQLFVFMH